MPRGVRIAAALGAIPDPPNDECDVIVTHDSSPEIEQLHIPTGTARPQVQTTLGVAPLEPATVVRAPFVIDGLRPERTAMAALNRSGMPRPTGTSRLAKLAKRVRSVRWWVSRRRRILIIRRLP